MIRREFIKTQGITLSGLFIFPFVNREKYYYTFDELFTNKIFSNENLFYFKNTPIKNKLYSKLNNYCKIKNDHWYYIGEYDITLPIKNEYNQHELNELINKICERSKRYQWLCGQWKPCQTTPKGQPIWTFRNEKENILNVEVLAKI